MSLSLTYESPKDKETRAEPKLRHLRINRNIKNKQKISSSKNNTDNKENVKSFQRNNDLQHDISKKSKTDQNIKNKQKISSPKNNTDQNIQKEAQKEADDTQQINTPMQSNNNSQLQSDDIDMVIERQPVLPQEIPCPNAITDIQEHELASVHQNPAVVEAIQRFQQGELLHTIDTCKTCLETRPVFHATPPIHKGAKNQTNPISIKPWKMSEMSY